MEELKMTYKKIDLIEQIAKNEEITKAEAEKAVNRTFEGIQALVATMDVKDTLQLVGLITLKVAERKDRVGSHPKTKEPITIKGKKYLSAKMGKVFQDIVTK